MDQDEEIIDVLGDTSAGIQRPSGGLTGSLSTHCDHLCLQHTGRRTEFCEYCGSACDESVESPCRGCRQLLHGYWGDQQA